MGIGTANFGQAAIGTCGDLKTMEYVSNTEGSPFLGMKLLQKSRRSGNLGMLQGGFHAGRRLLGVQFQKYAPKKKIQLSLDS
jgi:hypothetical protein